MLENQLTDISDFVNSKDSAPIQFDHGLPRFDGKYVKFPSWLNLSVWEFWPDIADIFLNSAVHCTVGCVIEKTHLPVWNYSYEMLLQYLSHTFQILICLN